MVRNGRLGSIDPFDTPSANDRYLRITVLEIRGIEGPRSQ